MVSLCLLTTAVYAGAPAADGLDVEIDALRGKDWFLRATFVGWNEAGEAVFRKAECDPSVLGGKDPTCSLRLCTAARLPELPDWPDCPYDGWILELPDDPVQTTSVRAAVTPADVRSTYQRELANVTVARGVSLPRSTFKATITRESPSKGDVVITPRLRGFGPFVAFRHDASDEGREQRIESVTIIDAVRTVDRRCIAVVGYVTFNTFYESVRGTVPVPFAATRCRR